jgi:hypothetical protein
LGTALRVGFVVASAIAKINEQMSNDKAEFHALLELKEAETGEKIGRVYERFDDYKKNMEEFNSMRKINEYNEKVKREQEKQEELRGKMYKNIREFQTKNPELKTSVDIKNGKFIIGGL